MRPADLAAEGIIAEATGRHPVLDLDLKWARIALRAANAAVAEKYARRVFEDPAADEPTRTEALALLAAATEGQGRFREAIALLHDLDGQLDAGTGRALWLSVQTMLLRCYKTTGDYAHAISVGERAMSQFGHQVGEEEMLLVVSLADAHTERGDFTRAQMYLTNILSLAEQAGSLRVRGSALWNASIVASEEGRHDDAVEAAEQALALLGESDATRNLGRVDASLADVLLERGGPDASTRARQLGETALELARDEATSAEIARIVLNLARCDLLDGDPDTARSRVLEVHTMLDGADDGAQIDLAYADLVDAHALNALGETARALTLARAAAETTEQHDSASEASRAWAAVAGLARGVDDQLCLAAQARSMAAAGVQPTRFGPPRRSSRPAAKDPAAEASRT